MSWEEWLKMTKLMLDFHSLGKEEKEQILLMMDGYRYRQLQRSAQ